MEFACQQMTGFQCNSVTYDYLDSGVDTGSVDLLGGASVCDFGAAMWVECHKCYREFIQCHHTIIVLFMSNYLGYRVSLSECCADTWNPYEAVR